MICMDRPLASIPFSSSLQSFPASRSFPMSHFFTSGGQSISTLVYLSENCHLEQGSLSWTQPLLQSPPCYSRSHGGRITTLSPNPQGHDPSLWVVLASPFSQGPNHITGPLCQDEQHTATAGFSMPGPVSGGFSENNFTHAMT